MTNFVTRCESVPIQKQAKFGLLFFCSHATYVDLRSEGVHCMFLLKDALTDKTTANVLVLHRTQQGFTPLRRKFPSRQLSANSLYKFPKQYFFVKKKNFLLRVGHCFKKLQLNFTFWPVSPKKNSRFRNLVKQWRHLKG